MALHRKSCFANQPNWLDAALAAEPPLCMSQWVSLIEFFRLMQKSWRKSFPAAGWCVVLLPCSAAISGIRD